MNAMSIDDLTLSNDLDRQAMSALTGGGSALIYKKTTYGPVSSQYKGYSRSLTGFGIYNGKFVAWYDYKKRYKLTRTKTKHYRQAVWI